MFTAQTHKSVASLLWGMVLLTVPCGLSAATSFPANGAISGFVTNSLGIPQMGAVVVLMNHQEHIAERVLTDEHGEFRFLGLTPDNYAIRVTLATFVPALKKDILVQPGMRSILNVNLNSVFSSIQIGPPMTDNGSLMTDDWKWMLRSSPATRPVLRYASEGLGKDPGKNSSRGTVFSDTRGVVKLSGGEGPATTGIGNEADLGTAFALATSVFGNNLLEVSGNLGYGSQTGVPVAAFRTSYARADGGGPVVSATMRQLFLPGRSGGAAAGIDAAMPMLRSVSASLDDRTQISDSLLLQYGFTMDSISFGDRMNYFSPYARVVYQIDPENQLAVAVTSGNGRPDLAGSSNAGQDMDLQRDLNTLGLFPRVSVRGGRARVQRGEELEITYTRKSRSRTYELAAYREDVTNAALTLMGAQDGFGSGELLPDLFTGNAVFNAGDYKSTGYSASVTQNLGSNVSGTITYGTLSGITVQGESPALGSAEELRSAIRTRRRQAVTARIAATSPWTGTHVIASYQWSGDHGWVTPGRLYSTQALRPMPGLNVYVRQPIPGLSVLPWRVEATADLRNMLAEGYLPLDAGKGQQMVLVQSPRSVRGGLSFIF